MPVEVVREDVGIGEHLNPHTAENGNQGRSNLHHEFQEGGQVHAVVQDPQDHNHHRPQEDAPRLRRDGDEQEDAHHEADEDGQASQAGNRGLVHPASVLGHVDGPHLVGEGLDHRRHDKGDHQGRQKGQEHIAHKLVIQYHGRAL